MQGPVTMQIQSNTSWDLFKATHFKIDVAHGTRLFCWSHPNHPIEGTTIQKRNHIITSYHEFKTNQGGDNVRLISAIDT